MPTSPTSFSCPWPGTDELMIKYHDTEWGVPVFDDRKLFEFIVLESAQAGLSWRTILHKREGYKRNFANFDPKKVSKFTDRDVARIIKDPGIIRNRLKIEATISNAQRFLEVQKEFGTFSDYMWGFVTVAGAKGKDARLKNARPTKWHPIDGKRKKSGDVPAITPEAEALSKDLKKRGFKFLGPTVVYAHMQAVGMVNDHLTSCARYKEIKNHAR